MFGTIFNLIGFIQTFYLGDELERCFVYLKDRRSSLPKWFRRFSNDIFQFKVDKTPSRIHLWVSTTAATR